MKHLAAVTARYLGRPFAEVGCIELVCRLLDDLGTPLPDAVDGHSQANYRALLDRDRPAAQRAMLAAFARIGRPGNLAFPGLGDLLVVHQAPDTYFPAVYVGAGQAIASFIRNGVQVFRLDEKNSPVMVRRVA